MRGYKIYYQRVGEKNSYLSQITLPPYTPLKSNCRPLKLKPKLEKAVEETLVTQPTIVQKQQLYETTIFHLEAKFRPDCGLC